ncbi:MAG: 50S ribosomal protein L11 methyltransferase [Deltaproteobacteria bacterium]|nr:50S ribosomal protein L11 methyltransferase [Deltaproteobacteria bacterium]
MKPETPLTIFELRAANKADLLFLDSGSKEEQFGPELAPHLAGFHVESDFAFLFFVSEVDLSPFLERRPGLEIRQTHHLRYDQWQDGAASPPIVLGPLQILPVFGAEAPPSIAPRPLGALEPLAIDPGLAFGFGGHPTTRACLEFLLRLYKPGSLESASPKTVLDLGCGTGILSLAAVRLGAASALGVDHSHLAADSAILNARKNGLADRVTIRRGLAQDFAAEPAELVLANIPLFVLSDLLELKAFDERRHLVISGLLPDEGDAFLNRLTTRLKVKVLDRMRSDRWVSFLIESVA